MVLSYIVVPDTVNEVAMAVKTLTLLDKVNASSCKFAIRGGGSMPWAGSANINGGVTIDMRSLRDVTINADRSVALIGAGAI